jgi:predicted metal-binding protein
MIDGERCPSRGDVELVVCETCASARTDVCGRSGGAQLHAQLVEQHTRAPLDPSLTIRTVRCLWACKRACNVHIRSQGRAGYVLCDLEPDPSTARAVLEYASLYAQSLDGSVPFRSWPDAVRGHFLCRMPPATSGDEESSLG